MTGTRAENQPERGVLFAAATCTDLPGFLPLTGQEFWDYQPQSHRQLWVHLDRNSPDTADWLRRQSGIHSRVAEALLSQETRPRCERFDDGVLLILRGVNLNPGADPEDMVSLRIFLERDRLITVRLRPLHSVRDVSERIRAGHGPQDLLHLFSELVESLFSRMEPTILDINEELDAIEEEMLEGVDAAIRNRLKDYRYRAIVLRRYVAPQRDALQRLLALAPVWMDDMTRAALGEATDKVARFTEDLEAAREKCALIQDEIANQLAERMNARMYVLSIVAAVFLPLGLLTGLLGINVGGMPGVDSGLAFWTVTVVLVLLGFLELWLLRRLRWL